MSWCDKLASTPTLGFRFAPHHNSSDSLLDSLSPLFDAWVDGRKQRFNIDVQQSFGVQFTTEDGFHYQINQENVVVEFRHRWRVKARSGGLPTAELISKAKPFTQLLPEVATRAVDAAELINGTKARALDRIGVVAMTTVMEGEAPPGIRRLISFVGKPWKGKIPHYEIQITGEIEEGDEYADRCIHSLTKAEDNPENLVTIKLDWQRAFRSGKPITMEVVKKHVGAAQKGALKYFEDVAEGSRFDEQILHSST